MKLSDARTIGVDPRLSVSADIATAVNSQDLLALLDHDNILLHYPKSLQDSLLQRTYTFIPGTEGFPEVNIHCSPLKDLFYIHILCRNMPPSPQAWHNEMNPTPICRWITRTQKAKQQVYRFHYIPRNGGDSIITYLKTSLPVMCTSLI
jgi:hypothetical protein